MCSYVGLVFETVIANYNSITAPHPISRNKQKPLAQAKCYFKLKPAGWERGVGWSSSAAVAGASNAVGTLLLCAADPTVLHSLSSMALFNPAQSAEEESLSTDNFTWPCSEDEHLLLTL